MHAKQQRTNISTGFGCLILLVVLAIGIGIIMHLTDPRNALHNPVPVPHSHPEGLTNSAPESNATSKTTAKVLGSKLTRYKPPGSDQVLQEVIVTWQNTGATPIRAVDAIIVLRDSSGTILRTYDYTIYAVSDFLPGVAPGKIYTDPPGKGFKLLDWEELPGPVNRRSTSVDVQITDVLESSAF